MSGITVLTPSKLKDQLTSLRESISSLDASSSPISGLAILLTIELATRDVHFALSPSTISDTDVISLLDAVNNTAGKSAIGKDAYPQQLMTALFAAGGMAAASASCPKSDSMSNAVRDACTKTMKRCKDVNDGRFYTLLKLLSTDISDASALMTDIAYASYLYGAGKYALDQMPMWKRCLDCALGGEENHQSCTNPKTIIPLKNMMRIAHAKGNAKRVEELKVWLVCGYIGAVRERMMRDDSARKEETVFEKMSLQQLVGDFFLRQTSLAKIENASIESLLELADESLAACAAPTDDTSDESKLLYFFLQIQLHHLAEEVKIHQEVQQLIRAKKNRWPDKDTKGSTKGGKLSATAKLAAKPESIEVTAADKAEMYNQTQRKVLLEAWNAWYESKQGEFAPSGLRAAINSCSVSCDLLRDCHETLTSQIQRLMKVVLALQQKRNGTKKGKSGVSSDALLACWGQVLAFVSPLMTDYLSGVVAEVYDGHVLEEKESYSREKNAIKQNGIDSFSIELSLRSLLESASQSFVSAGWMCEPLKYESGEMFRAMPQLFSIAHRSLSLCKIARDQHDQSSIQAVQKKSAFSSVDESDAETAHQLQLDLSLQAVEFRMELRDVLNTDITVDSVTKIAHKATTSALMSTKSASSPLAQSANAKFGTQFLQLIYAWSGLSINPWPFCNLTQGRTILRNSRESLDYAGKVWGRETQDIMENLLLEIAEADLEGTVVGGNVDNATQKYEQVLYTIEANDYSRGIRSRGMALLKSHCLLGLARVSLMRNTLQSEQYARSALDTLDGLKQDSECTNSTLLCVYAWDDVKWGNFACLYHDSASRQLVAETLIRSSRLDQAESFLLDAVTAAPANFDAAFSLAAFQLRKVLLGDSENIDLDSCKREAKTTLLKCAKMDKNSPLPFALLGLFYELEQDVSRAIGCYRKALSIDPSNAVSGRGLYRLLSLDEMKPFCEAALKQPSHSHGWAWRIIGQLRYSKHGDYDSAIVCFQQALRCRDVNAPDKDVLAVFYADLKTSKTDEEETSNCEVADIWCDLGSCYRDMGKWSGSNRAFEAAREVSRGNLSPNSLVAWAQVALELGLCNDASERCFEAISISLNPQIQRLASYITGQALLAAARQNLVEGKYGACLAQIYKGTRLKAESYSELKLLGDLYSLVEAVPSYVFFERSNDVNSKDDVINAEVKQKLNLLAEGARSYSHALELAKNTDTEEKSYLIAAAATDLGCNLLAQARSVALVLGDGSGANTHTSMADINVQYFQLKNIISESINAFICAIDFSPDEAAAWCGIGCALASIDPLKAQHAFSRALELDKSSAEAWCNLCLIFSHYNSRDKGSEILDALTQAEDSPLMWICRGLLFESASDVRINNISSREGNLAKAADAYRAALQIYKHPSAVLGLALTCRRNDLGPLTASDAIYPTNECKLNMSIYQSIAGGGNYLSSYVNSFVQLEQCMNQLSFCNAETTEDVLKSLHVFTNQLKECKVRMGSANKSQSTFEMVQCKIGPASVLSLKKVTHLDNIPHEVVDRAIAKVSEVLGGNTSAYDIKVQPSLEDSRNAVYFNPDSGEKWLTFARTLANVVCLDKSSSYATRAQKLPSSKAAASRAYCILHESVAHASIISLAGREPADGVSVDRAEIRNAPFVASAEIVSEALSLFASLDYLEKLHANERPSKSLLPSVSMQEAYLLDPTNSIAAHQIDVE